MKRTQRIGGPLRKTIFGEKAKERRLARKTMRGIIVLRLYLRFFGSLKMLKSHPLLPASCSTREGALRGQGRGS